MIVIAKVPSFCTLSCNATHGLKAEGTVFMIYIPEHGKLKASAQKLPPEVVRPDLGTKHTIL